MEVFGFRKKAVRKLESSSDDDSDGSGSVSSGGSEVKGSRSRFAFDSNKEEGGGDGKGEGTAREVRTGHNGWENGSDSGASDLMFAASENDRAGRDSLGPGADIEKERNIRELEEQMMKNLSGSQDGAEGDDAHVEQDPALLRGRKKLEEIAKAGEQLLSSTSTSTSTSSSAAGSGSGNFSVDLTGSTEGVGLASWSPKGRGRERGKRGRVDLKPVPTAAAPTAAPKRAVVEIRKVKTAEQRRQEEEQFVAQSHLAVTSRVQSSSAGAALAPTTSTVADLTNDDKPGISGASDTNIPRIRFRTRVNGKHEWTWEVENVTAFGEIIGKFAEIYSVPVQVVKFKFDGDRIEDSKTPEDLEMEGDELVDVLLPPESYDAAVKAAEEYRVNPQRLALEQSAPAATPEVSSSSSSQSHAPRLPASSSSVDVTTIRFNVLTGETLKMLPFDLKMLGSDTLQKAVTTITKQPNITPVVPAGLPMVWLFFVKGRKVAESTTVGSLGRDEIVHIMPKLSSSGEPLLLLYNISHPSQSMLTVVDLQKKTLSGLYQSAARMMSVPKNKIKLAHSSGCKIVMHTVPQSILSNISKDPCISVTMKN